MRRWWSWLAALAPSILGLGLALLLQSGRLPNPVLHLEADLGTILLLVGLLLSGGAVCVAALGAGAGRRLRQAVAEEREEAAEAHRRFVRRLDHEGIVNLCVGDGYRRVDVGRGKRSLHGYSGSRTISS